MFAWCVGGLEGLGRNLQQVGYEHSIDTMLKLTHCSQGLCVKWDFSHLTRPLFPHLTPMPGAQARARRAVPASSGASSGKKSGFDFRFRIRVSTFGFEFEVRIQSPQRKSEPEIRIRNPGRQGNLPKMRGASPPHLFGKFPGRPGPPRHPKSTISGR